MIFTWLCHKIKAFFLILVNLFRRALCCIRKRKRSLIDTAPLTHVVSNTDKENDGQNWTRWDEEYVDVNKPKTVQDYIEQYRQHKQAAKAKIADKSDENPEPDMNLFEDMTPKITRQTKVLVKTKNAYDNREKTNSRLNVVEDSGSVMPSAELEEWGENSGWEGEQLLDKEAQQILREQKRLERERKAWEQHQKRLERSSRGLGSKLGT